MVHMSRMPCCIHSIDFGPPAVTGRTLAACRTLFGLAAENVATTAGLTPYSLSRLERGHRQPAPGEVARLLSSIGQLAERSEPIMPMSI
jgi:hypothetical protein